MGRSFHEREAILKCVESRAGEARGWENAGMDILLNGIPTTVPDPLSVAQLLDDNGLASRRVAIEVNGAIVPRSDQATRTLQAGDRVEIVHALGGG